MGLWSPPHWDPVAIISLTRVVMSAAGVSQLPRSLQEVTAPWQSGPLCREPRRGCSDHRGAWTPQTLPHHRQFQVPNPF